MRPVSSSGSAARLERACGRCSPTDTPRRRWRGCRSVARSDDNAAAAAVRTGELQIVCKRPGVSSGALAAPMLSREGCIGALTAEIKNGGETSARRPGDCRDPRGAAGRHPRRFSAGRRRHRRIADRIRLRRTSFGHCAAALRPRCTRRCDVDAFTTADRRRRSTGCSSEPRPCASSFVTIRR